MTTAKLLALVGAVTIAAGAAMGQDAPLKGPPVKQERPAGLGGQFSEGKDDRKGPMSERVPMRIYAEAIEKLRGEGTPEGLRLSPEQNLEIRQIEMNFRNTMQEYTRRAKADGAGKNKAAGGQDGDQMTEESRRARAQELMRNAPNPTDAQVKVYAILNAEQRKFVDAEVARAQGEMEKRRTEEYMQRQLKKQQGENGKPNEARKPGPPDQPGPATPEARERARRIMERLQQLPPEEREQLLRRLEEELDRRVGGEGQRPRPKGGDRKPPPRIEDVKVPAPDKP